MLIDRAKSISHLLVIRVDDARVFYDGDELAGIVKVEAIGRKHGNRLFIHGEEHDL
ncbi:MAG: hypothetical protein HY706_05130 [Candidatus Hydrogenedentes bacterium]|nr:hypothetical protein [Candidatus Hydrogenedentota bacterium]